MQQFCLLLCNNPDSLIWSNFNRLEFKFSVHNFMFKPKSCSVTESLSDHPNLSSPESRLSCKLHIWSDPLFSIAFTSWSRSDLNPAHQHLASSLGSSVPGPCWDFQLVTMHTMLITRSRQQRHQNVLSYTVKSSSGLLTVSSQRSDRSKFGSLTKRIGCALNSRQTTSHRRY